MQRLSPSSHRPTAFRRTRAAWRTLGGRKRLNAQYDRLGQLISAMSDAGMVRPPARRGYYVDCFGIRPRKLSDPEMIKEMDERLGKQLQAIQRMEQLSRIVLRRG